MICSSPFVVYHLLSPYPVLVFDSLEVLIYEEMKLVPQVPKPWTLSVSLSLVVYELATH